MQVLARRKARLAPYDRALQKFQYGAALDAALAGGQPQVVASVLEELAARGGLTAALGMSPLIPTLSPLPLPLLIVVQPSCVRVRVCVCVRAWTRIMGACAEVLQLPSWPPLLACVSCGELGFCFSPPCLSLCVSTVLL